MQIEAYLAQQVAAQQRRLQDVYEQSLFPKETLNFEQEIEDDDWREVRCW